MNTASFRALRWLCVGLVFTATHAQGQLVTDNTVTPEEAVDIIIGEGIDFFNITYSGDADQIGSFDASASNILIGEGMMLATGSIEVAVGPNDGGGTTTGGGNFGTNDPDLDLLSTFNTNDAAVLEFDFISQGDSVSFNYTFASEEYNEYVCGSVNDAFGFFLSGPGISGPYENDAINLAIIPDTDIPVTINTVNLGVSGSAGTPANCDQVSPDWAENTEYYIDNDSNTDPNSTEMDGFTVVLTAAAQVECGEQYHIKIAIADAGDTAFDSCVFLEGGSFSANAVEIDGEADVVTDIDLPDSSILEGCVDGTFTFTINPDALESDTVYFDIGGSAENGVDYEEIDDFIVLGPDFTGEFELEINPLGDGISEGDETVEITYIFTNSCGFTDTSSATLNIIDLEPISVLAEDLFICPGESETSLSTISGGFPPYIYDWSSGGTTSSETYDYGNDGSFTLAVADLCGQSASTSINVVSGALLTSVSPEEWYCVGIETAPLFSGGVDPVEFTFNEGPLYINDNASFGAVEAGIYTVTATDACDQSVSETFEYVVCDTTIPNVFTPGNGTTGNAEFNNFFVIAGIEGFPESRLTIFNRWGNLVYESEFYVNNWEGRDQNGDPLSQGTYYYVFERSDGENYSGHVTLLRE